MATLEEMRERRKTQPSRNKTYGDRKVADAKYEMKRERQYKNGQFIAWDGEGTNTDVVKGVSKTGEPIYEHKYILMMNSHEDKIVDMDGLSTEDCLLFLCSIKERFPDHINVVFGGSYDVNMVLKDLPYNHLKILQRTNRVFWKYFAISYVPRKYFRVAQYDHSVYGDKRKRKPLWTVTLWDTIGFFQGSFVKSLEEYFKTDEERAELHLDEIKEGKARRNEFSEDEDELNNFVIPYTTYECKALVMLMEKLQSNMVEAEIHLKRWDGAGAAAAAVLEQRKVKSYYADLPPEVERAAQVAYGGGRVEMLKYGHFDNMLSLSKEEFVHHYDVIGAYPDKMPRLPALIGGEWEHLKWNDNMLSFSTSPEMVSPNTVYKIYWDYRYKLDKNGRRNRRNTDGVIYPFFYRRPWSGTRILYPEHGYSWVWAPELESAIRHFDKLYGEIRLIEAYRFHPKYENTFPFAFVPELYKRRLEMKKLGLGGQLALKLAINSFYGKTAQTVGYQGREDRKPPFYNLMYAGLITSYTRAQMFDAAMQAPESIIAIATDGIWSTEPLDLDIGEDLGQWEYERLSAFTSIQAGVYFARKENEEQVYHYRGFNQGSISEEEVREVWAGRGYNIHVPTRRFVTLGSAIASEGRMNGMWRTWDNSERVLQVFPSYSQKRYANSVPVDWNGRTVELPDERAAHSLISTLATPDMKFEQDINRFSDISEEYLSKAHPLPWSVVEETEEDRERNYQELVSWEVIESDL